MSDDPRTTLYRRLRAEAAELMGLDAADLSGLASMQVDLVGILMLEIDDMQATSVAGRLIDMGRLADAVRILRSLMPTSEPLAAPVAQPDFDGAHEALSELLTMRAHNLEAREASVSERLKAEIAEKDALIERLRAEASGTPQAPPPSTSLPQQTSLPRPTSPQPPLSPPSAGIPAHYLRRDDGFSVIEGGRGFDRWRNNNV
jgi:hypothetical protein